MPQRSDSASLYVGPISRVHVYLVLMRPHQWVKNVLVFAPLFFSPPTVNLRTLLVVFAGFACFCALSSGVYAINDLCDRNVDRLHPRKRNRPLAAGQISALEAVILSFGLICGALALAYVLSPIFALIAAIYVAMNIAYSCKLKNVSIVDILVVATGFVLRLDSGAILVNVEPSAYLMTCTGLMALFMALGKRRDDLVKQLSTDHRESLSGYTPQFLDISMAIVLGALLVCYLIYTMDPAVMHRFGTDKLYLTLPFVIAGIMRYLQITVVEEKSGSPTRIVTSDKFMITTVCGWIVVFAMLIYL